MRRLLGLAAIAFAIAACSAQAPAISSGTGGTTATSPAGGGAAPGATDPVAAHERAQAVLSAWAAAVAAAGNHADVTPVGELTGQIGDWEAAVGDNNKQALMAGMVFSDNPLPDQTPPDGTVAWQDGTVTKVPVESAQDALVAIGSTAEASSCSGCTPLTVTDATLTSGPIQTSRGPATAPLWEFTVQGSAVKVTRVAIANAVVATSPGEGDPQLGLAVDSARGAVSGTDLTVSFVGAPDPGNVPCGEDYTAEAVESDLAIVVIVTRHPHDPPIGEACSAVGARRTVTASLAAPLGDRVVLDLQQGTPVPVVVSP
jgi:hypothetical protein